MPRLITISVGKFSQHHGSKQFFLLFFPDSLTHSESLCSSMFGGIFFVTIHFSWVWFQKWGGGCPLDYLVYDFFSNVWTRENFGTKLLSKVQGSMWPRREEQIGRSAEQCHGCLSAHYPLNNPAIRRGSSRFECVIVLVVMPFELLCSPRM